MPVLFRSPCLSFSVTVPRGRSSKIKDYACPFPLLFPLLLLKDYACPFPLPPRYELRCTALGGLSITPTSLAIEARLTARKAACGAGTCGCG